MKPERVLVRTRIITEEDNIVDVIEEYTKDFIQPGDLVAVSESVVAITQGRIIRPHDLKPGLLAKTLCRFVDQKGSLSSAYGMQVAMNCGGKYRVLLAFLLGSAAKLVGKGGVFYRFAGEQAALIDDITGTMPPYDKFIVLGPDNPDKVAEEIKARVGAHAAVTDVNDLRRAAVLGASKGVDKARLAQVLIDNPFGNADEQTPIVVIKDAASLGIVKG